MDRRWHALGDLRVLPDDLLCAIIDLLSPADIGRLACVSSVLYILCNEEPLWMGKSLSISGLLEYKGSWKKTALSRLNICSEHEVAERKALNFDGFSSFFLYRRWYRCFTKLSEFNFDSGQLERKENISSEEFHSQYDGKRPVLLTKIAELWPAKTKWTLEQMSQNYGDIAFRISHRSSQKITMRLKDYVCYVEQQHDEDPLYIFDDKFGEAAPALLEDYSVPHLFREDFFDVLDNEKRPSYRWLIIGPERSGASWHVDPGLTSAWNTLLLGRKRWALYPPGRVPAGVTVHVNEDDGDVNIETPTSLQWWLEMYPHLAEHDKPIECTQLPGETIFVPSGWWHCVLNLDKSIAVTQNFVNKVNFEIVCLDMAPGHVHKGVSRAGLLAAPDTFHDNMTECTHMETDCRNYPELAQKEKRQKCSNHLLPEIAINCECASNKVLHNHDHKKKIQSFSYDIKFLSGFLEKWRDHYSSVWSPSNYIGPREIRYWLHKLWLANSSLRPLIWKGACIAISADKWYECILEISKLGLLPIPSEEEKLPVGTGSNPVFVLSDNVIKLFVEEGYESAVHSLGAELEFYHVLEKTSSPLRGHIPDFVGSGFVMCENGSFKALSWDGKIMPEVVPCCSSVNEYQCATSSFPFGLWSKIRHKIRDSGTKSNKMVWPYLITKRCEGQIFAEIREDLSKDVVLSLASSLGILLRNLHLVPTPSIRSAHNTINYTSHNVKLLSPEWEHIITIMEKRRRDAKSRLSHWGQPIPQHLVEVVEEYLPSDSIFLFDLVKDEDGLYTLPTYPSYVHSDIMDDNIIVEISYTRHQSNANDTIAARSLGTKDCNSENEMMRPVSAHIIDFSDLSVGHPLTDLIPIHLDVFRGDAVLLRELLKSYRLSLFVAAADDDSRFGQKEKLRRLSYRAMCFCILHEENVLGAIFSLRKELRTAPTWEVVEEAIWGELNNYQHSFELPM